MAYPPPDEQMQAQVLEEFNKPYQFRRVNIPQDIADNEVIVQVAAAGYCHTDLAVAAGTRTADPRNPLQLPHIGCHEFAGTVVSHASNPTQDAAALQLSARVGVPGRGHGACGSCFECNHPGDGDQAGYSFFCPEMRSNGITTNGGFAEYAVVDARQCVPLPDGMQMIHAAPMMCAGVTIYNAIKRCGLQQGQRLAILGAGGGLGHLGLQFGEAMGLRMMGVDAADGPLELARGLKTRAEIVDARAVTAESVVERVGKEDGRAGADRGFDAVIILPEAQVGFDYGMKLLRNHAVCVAVSIPPEGWHVSAVDLVFRGIVVKGSILGSRAVLKETVAFAAKHGIAPVTTACPLEKLNDLVEDFHKGLGARLVVDMSLNAA